MVKEMNIVDACNLLNIEMDGNWKGASGEDRERMPCGEAQGAVLKVKYEKDYVDKTDKT